MEKAMNLTHKQLLATLVQVVHDEGAGLPSKVIKEYGFDAAINAYGFGYMTSWLASIALKHPALLKELMDDPRFIRARQTLENAG
jgi:hypothetical protein